MGKMQTYRNPLTGNTNSYYYGYGPKRRSHMASSDVSWAETEAHEVMRRLPKVSAPEAVRSQATFK
jgi:hypothetical protein